MTTKVSLDSDNRPYFSAPRKYLILAEEDEIEVTAESVITFATETLGVNLTPTEERVLRTIYSNSVAPLLNTA